MKNQEKNQSDLQNAKVQKSGRIQWHRIHKLGGTKFPRISEGWKENYHKYHKINYS
jgi:hypothetical protein